MKSLGKILSDVITLLVYAANGFIIAVAIALIVLLFFVVMNLLT